jgi:hypothetical protein
MSESRMEMTKYWGCGGDGESLFIGCRVLGEKVLEMDSSDGCTRM